MVKQGNRLAYLLIALLGLSTTAIAMPSFQSGDQIAVTGEHDDMAFAAGHEINVNAVVPHMMFVAGGKLGFTGGEIKSLITSGGELNFQSAQIGDLLAAGGELNLTGGTVADGAVIAGGRIATDPGFTINGSAVISGGQVKLAGPIGKSATVSGGRIEINNEIKGDAHLTGAHIIIGPTAKIDGDLTYRARRIDISSSAVIAGKTTALPYRARFSEREIFGFVVGGLIIAAMLYFGGSIVLALALVALAPELMAATAARIRAHALATLGAGLLWVVAAPVAIGLLCMTIIGIPLGLVLIALYIIAFPFGGTVAAHFAGMVMRTWLGGKGEPAFGARLGWTVLGTLVLCALVIIPFIGGLIWIIADVMGLGALVSEIFGKRQGPAAAAA